MIALAPPPPAIEEGVRALRVQKSCLQPGGAQAFPWLAHTQPRASD